MFEHIASHITLPSWPFVTSLPQQPPVVSSRHMAVRGLEVDPIPVRNAARASTLTLICHSLLAASLHSFIVGCQTNPRNHPPFATLIRTDFTPFRIVH